MNRDNDHIEKELTAYLEGSISPEQRKTIEDHLGTCKQCSSVLREWKQVKEAIGTLECVEPPPWLVSKIMHSVREQKSLSRSLLNRLFTPFYIKIPAHAIAMCVIAIMVLFVHNHFGPETISEPEYDRSVTALENRDAPEAPMKKGLDATNRTQSKITKKLDAGNASASGSNDNRVPEKELSLRLEPGERRSAEQQNVPGPPRENLKKEQAPAAMSPKSKSIFESVPGAADDNPAVHTAGAEAITFTIATDSFQQTAEQVRDFLARYGARNPGFSLTTLDTALVTGEIPSANLQAFSDALERLVNVQSRRGQFKERQGYTPVRIEILKSNSNH